MAGTPVVFIHGLWMHASSWQSWVELFEKNGYAPVAPGWPGEADSIEETRASPAAMANVGVDAIAAHYADVIATLPAPPIVIGHSVGGLIVQRLLGEGRAAAGVAIDPAPVKGVLALPLSVVRAFFPVLKNPGNIDAAIPLTEDQFRYSFGNALTAEESAELHRRWAIATPARPLFQVAAANVNPGAQTKVDTGNITRGPLLLTMGGLDHAVPESLVKATYKKYRKSPAVTELKEFADRGHSLTIDHGWREVADHVLSWLGEKGLGPT